MFRNNGAYFSDFSFVFRVTFTSAGQDISITEQVFAFLFQMSISGSLYGNFVLVFMGTFHQYL